MALGILTQISLMAVHVTDVRAARASLTLFTTAFALCVVALELFSVNIEESVAPMASVTKLIGN